ncbi:hypothetical protein CY35_19G013500 [Sphagnum magellanicum]|nr:hypothetical protein CY35_19G013500 [Sphagnum magellanicum]KAH9531015.1 hypothetical protein CY35_19G013500 [Sphagnum magellanicum]
MPLVRYELRNELGLANPQLYRTAGKDDSQALLAGVAMAGLVGIIRQLGDLAEFAADIFNDLHTEAMTIMGCYHDLKARVTKLELVLPAVEKSLLAEASHLRFIYSPEWHASLPSDENHFMKRDLPCFLHNLYDDCRGPPRLFLLDKFDGAGAGACVKRYTDPSIFMKIWADSELKKAEQEQQKARRERKEAKLHKKRLAIAGFHPKPRERFSVIHLGNLEGFSGSFIPSMKAKTPLRQGLDQILEIQENGDQTPLQLITDSGSTEEAQTPSLAPLGIDNIDTEAENMEDNIAKINMMLEEDGEQMPLLQLATGSRSSEEAQTRLAINCMNPKVENLEDNFTRLNMSQEEGDQLMLLQPMTGSRSVEGALAQPSAVLAINSTLDMEAEIWEDHFERPNQVKVGDTKLQQEEGASDSDYFVDALTTLESESESDTESRTWPEPDTHLPKIVVSEEASLLNHSVLKAHVESQRQLLPRGIDLLEEPAGLSHMVMFKPYNVLDVDSPLDLEYEDRCPWMESIKPPMPLRDFGVVETDHHAQFLPPEVVIEDVDRGTHQLSELETKSQPETGLSSEQNEMGMVALVNLQAQKEHDEFQRQRPHKEPASPQLSAAPHDDFVIKSPSLKQCDEHPSSIMEANKPPLGTKHLDIEGEQACSLVASEIVGDKRELDNCSRTTIVLNFETQAWPTQAHESSESDQSFSDLQTLPHCSIRPQEEESMSELSSLQHKQPPSAVVELTELPVSLETLGADEGNGPGKIAKEFIYNEEGAGGLGGLVSESQAQPGLDEVTVLGQGSQLLNQSAVEKHVESRRQRRRWDINRVHEQAQVPQLAVEPEDDVVIESPEQITSAVDSIEPQLFFQSRGTMRGNGHAQLTSNTMGDKMQSELKLQGWPHPNDVLEARVPAESPSQSSHTATKKPAKSRRQRPSKSMDLEKAVCQTKLKHEDLRNKSSVRRQPHSVVMLTKPPTFLEYLGTRRENGDMSMECDSLSAHGQKLDDQGSQESPGFRSQGLDFTESDEASPLTHSDMKKHAESRRQRPRWDINKVKKQLVLTEILRPESDLVTASSALDTEEPDSLLELSEPPMMSSSKGIKLPHSPVINGHAQVISNEQRVDDPEADRDSPELSEPPMAPEEVGLANSPEVNGHHAHVVTGHIVEDQARTDHDSVEVSEPPVMPSEEGKIKKRWTILNGHAQVISSEQIVDGQGLDCDSPDVKELILRSDQNAVSLYKGEDTLPHENHHGIEQEPRTTTSLPSLSSSPYTLLSSPTSDENRDEFDCTSSASSPQWSTPSNALHSPPDSPARSSRGLFLSSPVHCNNSKFCTESGIIVQGPPAHVPVPSSCPMTSTCLPIQQDSIDDRPSHSWNLWSCQTLKLPPRAIPLVTQQLQQSSPRVSSLPDSNQMSDAEIDEALMDAISGNCMGTVAAMDLSNILGNQNISMELNRKQYQRRQRHSGLQKRQGSCPVTCNNFTVAAIMEKANAIRQEIMNSDEDEEENEDLKRKHM